MKFHRTLNDNHTKYVEKDEYRSVTISQAEQERTKHGITKQFLFKAQRKHMHRVAAC